MSFVTIPTYRFCQSVDQRFLADPYSSARQELRGLELPVRPGQSVAITAGSRGITDIVPITLAVVDHFKERGLAPFIVPAMGSHGGGRAESQAALLAQYGLTEQALGCPIRSSVETVQLGTLPIETGTDHSCENCPILFDRIAFEADHLFLVNRVKAHTRFSGPIESGLLKMFMIGLGNPEGASRYHRAVSDARFPVVIRQVTSFLMQKTRLLGGLGIVENGLGKTAILKALSPDSLAGDGEEKLLHQAKELQPKLPFEEIDLLLIEQIGKNISGTGFDPNVVGRKYDDHKAVSGERPIVRCIAVLGLTEETAGNANGIGMAEFCLSSVLEKIDWESTRLNAMTANHVSAAMVPLDYRTENEIIHAAWLTLGQPDPREFRLVRIKNTLQLDEMQVSEALLSIHNEPRAMLGE